MILSTTDTVRREAEMVVRSHAQLVLQKTPQRWEIRAIPYGA